MAGNRAKKGATETICDAFAVSLMNRADYTSIRGIVKRENAQMKARLHEFGQAGCLHICCVHSIIPLLVTLTIKSAEM